MSTLGRKAMKKTLERLKRDAFKDFNECATTFGDLRKGYDKMTEREQRLFDILFRVTFRALESVLDYIRALEDYGYELDEEWNKLLKSIEQTKPIERKEGKKKPSYRV